MSDNDIVIISGFIFFFILLGILAPILNAEFGTSYNELDTDSLEENIASETNEGQLSIWKIIFSLITIPFWSFGSIPLVLDLLIMLPIRIAFWLLIARNIWIGGGS